MTSSTLLKFETVGVRPETRPIAHRIYLYGYAGSKFSTLSSVRSEMVHVLAVFPSKVARNHAVFPLPSPS